MDTKYRKLRQQQGSATPKLRAKGGFAEIVIVVVVLVLAGIAGAYYLGRGTNKPQSSPVSTTSPSPMQDASRGLNSSAATANWETYTNEKMGITFKYPNTRKIEVFSANILEIVPLGYKKNTEEFFRENISLVVWDNPKNLSLKEYDDEQLQFGPGPGFYSSKNRKIVTANKVTAYYQDDGGCHPLGCQRYIIPSKKIVELRYSLREEAKSQEIFDQILSTFKFTE